MNKSNQVWKETRFVLLACLVLLVKVQERDSRIELYLRMIFSRNVFCGATRPLLPPGILPSLSSQESRCLRCHGSFLFFSPLPCTLSSDVDPERWCFFFRHNKKRGYQRGYQSASFPNDHQTRHLQSHDKSGDSLLLFSSFVVTVVLWMEIVSQVLLRDMNSLILFIERKDAAYNKIDWDP